MEVDMELGAMNSSLAFVFVCGNDAAARLQKGI